MNSFTPRITVATIIERNQRFLMVREDKHLGGALLYNQPAGHVEAGETLAEAAAREVFEETAWRVTIDAFVGCYVFQPAPDGPVYFRYCFTGTADQFDINHPLDSDIHDTVWLTKEEVYAVGAQHRSPIVLPCFEDYWAGRRLPLDTIYEHPWP